MAATKEVLCITSDRRLQFFNLEGGRGESTNKMVGEFAELTTELQVWAPIQCDNCLTTALRDLGEAFADEEMEDKNEREMGYERNRWYGGDYKCEACEASYHVETRFNHYALGGMFLSEKTQGCKVIPVPGWEDLVGIIRKANQEPRLEEE